MNPFQAMRSPVPRGAPRIHFGKNPYVTMTQSPPKMPTTPFVDALANGISVLEAFSETGAELTVSEAARLAGLTPATARRSLHTLAELGYLERCERRFVLSARVLNLASAYLRSTRSEEILLPELHNFVTRFGDASSIAVYDEGNVLYVAHYSEQRATRRIASVGTTYPAYATSMGKVLLSAMSADRFQHYLDVTPLRPLTSNTITSKDRLAEEIALCQSRGYATSRDELDYGVTALAVPIRSSSGTTIAALNTSGYSGRTDTSRLIAERLEDLRIAAKRIWQILEAHPTLLRSLPQKF
ncbi:Pca regulon regulatory protein [Castellaniella defragrans]